MIYENLPNAPATLPRWEGGGRHPQGGLAWLARHRAQETTAQRPNAKGPEKLFVQHAPIRMWACQVPRCRLEGDDVTVKPTPNATRMLRR